MRMLRALLIRAAACFCLLPCARALQQGLGKRTTEQEDMPLLSIEQRRLATIQFSIPVFALTFRSPNVLQGDVRADLDLLGSTVAGPLHDIVTEFVFESYRIQMARLSQSGSLPDIMRDLVMVDFEVTVVHAERNKEEDHSLRRSLSTGWFEFYAQFVGAAFFLEPLDPSSVPDAAEMEQMLGSWREQFMVEDFTILQKMLRETDDPILQNLDFLVVLNDANVDVFPDSFKKDNPTPYSDQEKPLGAPYPNDASSGGGSQGYKVLMSLLVIVGTATLAAMLFLVRPYVVKSRNHLGPQDGAFPSPPVSLPGRGEEEIPVDMNALEESDRWLQQHRPDLFRALQRSSSFKMTSTENGSDGIMNDNQNTKSAPLQFLFGGMFVRRNKDEPLPSISLASRDSQAMEESMEFHDSSSSQGWWHKLTHALQKETLACDEDPSQYDFAFSDFPRHDGTPCLMFSETETDPVLVRVMKQQATNNEALSNEDFKRQLSMHVLTEGADGGGLSLEQDEDPEFTNKLERLIAMRHRHYEKERLIQKGRQAREQERRQAEARERELKLRRHSMEIDLEEIEASLTPRALSRKNLQSQTSFDYDVDRKSHRITLSDSNYFAAVDPSCASPSPKSTISSVEMQTIGGPSKRCDNEIDPAPSPRSSWHTRHLSDSSPRKKEVIGRAQGLTPSPIKSRRSHRRSFSHGTQEMEEKKVEHASHKRNDSNAEDVMTFGIAAYTNFV